MLELVEYTLKEIIIFNNLLKIDNSSFHKRCLARLIAIRTDDFIKLCFKLNKATLRSSQIRNDLNTLQNLYEEFFKKQRDKYSAHIQDLDFVDRIELWKDIDYERVSFFSIIPIDIYQLFSSVPNYIGSEDLYPGISTEESDAIMSLNESLNIENSPRISSDILSLTRYNTGGMLYCSPLQDKAAVLKALEIIINYELSLLKVAKDSDLINVVKKLLILDVISYCDNLFTRTDLTSGSKQEMDGLDKLIVNSNLKTAEALLTKFKGSYKLDSAILELRNVRNKVCGHIDVDSSVTDIQDCLNSMKLTEIKLFYEEIRNLFEQICRQEGVFTPFLLGSEKLYGIVGFNYEPDKPFDEQSKPQKIFQQPNINNEGEIASYYQQLISTDEIGEDVRHFFWEGFISSEIVDRMNINILIDQSETRNLIIDFRKHHEFFQEKLSAVQITKYEKIKIINLFVICASGFPDTLSYILQNTYDINKSDDTLNLIYFFGLGELTDQRIHDVYNILDGGTVYDDFYYHNNALLGLFKIDIKSRRIGHGLEMDLNETYFSKRIKEVLNREPNHAKIANLLSLSSTLYFGSLSLYAEKVKDSYDNYFTTSFERSLQNFLASFDTFKEDYKLIIDSFKSRRYTACAVLIAEFLSNQGQKNPANYFFTLLSEQIITTPKHDDQEVHNLGHSLIILNELNRAIVLFNYLRKKNPTEVKYSIILLELYKDIEENDRFKELKEYLLANFELSATEVEKINQI